jgi:biopolymer transport protein ExbB
MMPESLEKFRATLEQGGPVFIAIILLSVLMWALIVERYWFFYLTHPLRVKRCVQAWQAREDRRSWYARQIRAGLIADVSITLEARLAPIHTLTTVLPLLGLLGTVAGMIGAFDVMASFGTGNIRGFTGAISQALLTTTAGLVTSISGLYFAAHLTQRAKTETQSLKTLLEH